MNQTFLSYSNQANGQLPLIRPVNLDKYIVRASDGLYLKRPIVTTWQHSDDWTVCIASLIFCNSQ